MIGVIADTHIYGHGARALPVPALDLFRRAGVGLIVHLGDVNIAAVLDELAEVAPVLAIAGNNDDDELQDALPRRLRFSVGTHTMGAIHGDGGRSAKDQVKRAFGGKVDFAIYGTVMCHISAPLVTPQSSIRVRRPIDDGISISVWASCTSRR